MIPPASSYRIPSIGLVLLVALAGCKPEAAEQGPPQQMQAAPVTAIAAITRDVPVYLDAIGKTVPTDVVIIVPQVGGKVTTVHIEDGAYVNKGQLLFEIDARPFEAAVAAVKAALTQAQAEATWAEADFKRTQELRGSNVVSQLEWDEKKSKVGAAEAKIEAAKAALEAANLNLEYTKIFSPLDGRAGARLVDPGNVVKANDAAMLTIQRLHPIYAEFTVTENDLGTVRKFMVSRGLEVGKEASLGLKVLVDVPGNSAQILAALGAPATQPQGKVGAREGKLTFLDNTVQGSTGTVKLRASVPNSDNYFWPGQFVNVRLVLTIKKDAVLIPAQAQQLGQQGPYVYVVSPEGTAQLRPIVPGQRQDDLLVVESGVKIGEKVIVTGQLMVAPGGKVMVTNEAPTAPQPAAQVSQMPNDQTRIPNE